MKLQFMQIPQDDLYRIHEATLKILCETGCVFHSQKALDTFKKHGANVQGKTVIFSKKLIKNSLKNVPNTFLWRARNGAWSTIIGGEGFRLGPNAGNIYVQDLDKGRRLAKLEDVRKIQTIHQMSDVTDFTGNNPCEPSDVETCDRHLYVTYETLKHSDKALVSYFAPSSYQAEETLRMVALAFGDDYVLENHHVIGTSVGTTCPLSYSKDALDVVTTFAENNQPVMITPAVMGGLTGPLDLIGIALQQNAELIAGTVYIQLINSGSPVVWGPSSTVAWLKTASYSTGSPEAMLPNFICLQLAKYMYKIPTRSMAGLTDSKISDCQAGYETMQNLMLAMLGGAQIIYEALGVLDNIMTTSYEKIIIDEELYRRVARIHAGVDLSSIEIPLKLIQDIGGGGEYLTNSYTLKNCRNMWRPTASSWGNYSEWEEGGSEELNEKANKIWKERLEKSPNTYLDEQLDRELNAFIESHKRR